MRDGVSQFARHRRHEAREARRVVQAPGFRPRAATDEGVRIQQGREPLDLQAGQIHRLDEIEAGEILRVILASPPQDLQQRERCGVLLSPACATTVI